MALRIPAKTPRDGIGCQSHEWKASWRIWAVNVGDNIFMCRQWEIDSVTYPEDNGCVGTRIGPVYVRQTALLRAYQRST